MKLSVGVLCLLIGGSYLHVCASQRIYIMAHKDVSSHRESSMIR